MINYRTQLRHQLQMANWLPLLLLLMMMLATGSSMPNVPPVDWSSTSEKAPRLRGPPL
jgi:hypothetical protein